MKIISITFVLFYSSISFGLLNGDDNRVEASALTGHLANRVNSVVTIVRRNPANILPNGGYRFDPNHSRKAHMPLCEGQRFADQRRPSEVVCGGVLVGPDLVLTAKHCVPEDQNEDHNCSDISIIFGYVDQRSNFPPNDSYQCQTVLWSGSRADTDVTLLKLDRPVVSREAVTVRTRSNSAEGQETTLIGPHARLSLKSSTGTIRYVQTETSGLRYGVATDMDCYTNDSGSPVFNSSGQLQGVFFAGGPPNTSERPAHPTVEAKEDVTPPPTSVALDESSPTSVPVISKGAGSSGTPVVPNPTCETQSFSPATTQREAYYPMTGGMPSPTAIGCTFAPLEYFSSSIRPFIQRSIRAQQATSAAPQNTVQ